jgi:hypothetical protein
MKKGESNMKPVLTDSNVVYVYYINGTKDIFGTYHKLNRELASINDVINHREIWDCPLVVKEGNFKYEDGYIRR